MNLGQQSGLFDLKTSTEHMVKRGSMNAMTKPLTQSLPSTRTRDQKGDGEGQTSVETLTKVFSAEKVCGLYPAAGRK